MHVLEAGDSLYFDSELSHAIRGLENSNSKAIVIVTAP